MCALLPFPAQAQQATSIEVADHPNDDGTAVILTFQLEGDELLELMPQIQVEGQWHDTETAPVLLSSLDKKSGHPEIFGWGVVDGDETLHPDDLYMVISKYISFDTAGEQQINPIGPALGEMAVRLVVDPAGRAQQFDAGTVQAKEQWFNTNTVFRLLIAVVFSIIIMFFILAARKNPNIFIRRIAGLEAVDEAIGRATEMGKPVLHINGLDSLATLSTVAAVNILGRIAGKVATYESDLLVPCFDPVVMTVSQEVVKNAYLEAGRPDNYREDNIYFLTDQQFSYTASVCGIMLREKPAANFLLGYFYAESLLLAETGNTTGAIQIAGTDAQAQLPFFITTCDYTLIGEELYAASAYLSREPMLLGSLRGQDVAKAFVMLMIFIGTLLSTFGSPLLTRLWTAL
ncbi:MAG: hypothetical protein H7A35_07440 [Planctomycetales bacterium]|nr:hypothetical protein [bacterium]UNM09884.1 MAG: hypothetical protein H7A35_07440 [Planctomycetales bacterium]